MQLDLLEILKHINPARLDYSQWAQVGMALKHEGFTAWDWDQWSSSDGVRYKSGECYKKWDTFNEEAGAIVTGGTLVQFAKDQGFEFNTDYGHELDWDDPIEKDELVVIDHHYLEEIELEEPTDEQWEPVKEIIKYLQTLFESTENVGYVTSVYQKEDGGYSPRRGNYDRTAGKLIEELSKCKGDIGSVLGDYKEETGAWIRFNPLDGKGVMNDNVTDYRYALVESDSVSVEKQNAIIRELELPVAALVYSGGKSVHAIVKIEAGSNEEYRKRVNYLYDVCKKNGLMIDTQNRNPSRLSRLPGVTRNGKKQFLMATNIGKRTWEEWEEWIEGVNDDLPDPEPLTDTWDNLPPLAPPLIEGVLRQGHKMLMAGPSKAGKSFALIELSIAIAEGTKWFGWQCTQGKVLYINLELDRASALHRFKDVYQGLGLKPNNLKNIDIWNLRGKVVPMDKLAPKLIRRAQKKGYIAVILDPIYKVITGDENSAEQMANFTNQFDKVASELGASVIYCHHHSKGTQGNKRSMDRASGSGVFARDPDALIDLVELELTDTLIGHEKDRIMALAYGKRLKELRPDYYEENVGPDDEFSRFKMRKYLGIINKAEAEKMDIELESVDYSGVLGDLDPEGMFGTPFSRQKGNETNKRKGKRTDEKIKSAIDNLVAFGEEPTFKDIAEYMKENFEDKTGASPKRIRQFVEESQDYGLNIREGERANRVVKQVGEIEKD